MGNLERLRKLYFNPKEQGSFCGVERLSNASGLRRRDVRKWLSQQDVYTLHKPVRYKFQRRKTIALVPQFRFAVGDIVRVSKARKTFRKGYLPGWAEETFRVYKRYPTIHPTYALQDFNSKEIDGRFYNEEL
ncbi:chromo domain-containing protein [Trichonephila clavipes]|nr:chromo domain-containing protein [Trichonephila clavipes]